MKIISKYQDFYDSALAYGSDDSIMYIRNLKEYEITKDSKYYPQIKTIEYPESFKPYIDLFYKSPVREFYFSNRLYDIKIKCSILGFCGQIYPVYEVNFKDQIELKYFYTLESLKDFIEPLIKNKKDFKFYIENDSSTWNNFLGIGYTFSKII